MRLTRKLTFVIAIAMMAGSCAMNRNLTSSKNTITPLIDKTIISEGSLVYGLPLTVIDVEIEAERVIEKPGPYSRYAEDLLGLTDVIKAKREFWSITGVTINTHEELDPEEFYIIETNSVFQSNVLALKRSGLILDLNPDMYNSGNYHDQSGKNDLNQLSTFDLGSDEYFQKKRDTLYRIVSLDTTFVRIPYLVEKKQKLSIDQLAEKAAIRLMELRDGKHLILTGETNLFPQDGAAINEMNRLEKEYLELFTGKTMKEKRIFRYQLIPRKEMTGKQGTIFRFSEVTGPYESAGNSDLPVIVEFIPEMKTRNLNIVSDKLSASTSQKSGKLYYRVPDVVKVKISVGGEVLSNSRKLIYQFGEIVRLPSNYLIGK